MKARFCSPCRNILSFSNSLLLAAALVLGPAAPLLPWNHRANGYDSMKTGAFISATFRSIHFPAAKASISTPRTSLTTARRPAASGAPPRADIDDPKSWRKLDLPHDWAVEGPFDPDANLTQQAIAARRRLVSSTLSSSKESDQGKNLELQFDGVATHCVVWVSTARVHRNWCGYNSFLHRRHLLRPLRHRRQHNRRPR